MPDPKLIVQTLRGSTVVSRQPAKEVIQSSEAPALRTYELLDGMKKDELEALAERLGISVSRSDGKDGEPLRDDYIDALRED